MAKGKWIGGFLGFIAGGGPLGALMGFALGALFDYGLDKVNEEERHYNNREYDDDDAYRRQRMNEGQRNSFMFSLLVLASYVIKADGKVMHSEMEAVRRFLRNNFGMAAQRQGEEILLKLFQQQNQLGAEQYRSVIRDSCGQIARNMPYEQRLQLLNFLVMIAKVDGVVVPVEVEALREITLNLGLTIAELEQMLSMGRSADSSSASALENAYRILGVSPSATDAEVKAAYRKMALQHHPDKVSALGEDVRKAAEKKFQEINDAKEKIYKARGL